MRGPAKALAMGDSDPRGRVPHGGMRAQRHRRRDDAACIGNREGPGSEANGHRTAPDGAAVSNHAVPDDAGNDRADSPAPSHDRTSLTHLPAVIGDNGTGGGHLEPGTAVAVLDQIPAGRGYGRSSVRFWSCA